MSNMHRLENTLFHIDGRSYAAYKQLKGSHRLGDFRLMVDHVQVDPYAPPSRMRIILDRTVADIPDDLLSDTAGKIAVSDFLTRAFVRSARRHIPRHNGTGNGGVVSIGNPGQEVLERTSVLITDNKIEARIDVGLPAAGRRVRGREAARLLTEVLPRIADASLRHCNLNAKALRDHVILYRDQEELRSKLIGAGLVAFVGNGAILPRCSGDSDAPLEHGAVPFMSPPGLEVTFQLQSGRIVTGMGIPQGVTVIVGGGYHGKSTLLRALERGVYPHIAGDGREWVITSSDAVTIRAEDERAITGVNISPFITNLPSGTDTQRFSTTSASGSTSQAANLMEALEAGATTLLIDEDISATNFMFRDLLMRQLIPSTSEPITPFIDRVRTLLAERNVSTILVAGGSGSFFTVADHVIALDKYQPHDVTAKAWAIAEIPKPQTASTNTHLFQLMPRLLDAHSLAAHGKQKPAKAKGRTTIQYGKNIIDLAAVAQLVDSAQTEAIARALDKLAKSTAYQERELTELVADLIKGIDSAGLDWLSPFPGHPGHLARPRPYEIHAAVNRYRKLRLAAS